jgi:AcrR family transcriptional regulator
MPVTARGQRTRQLILESTAQVFDKQGYAGATLNRLVESTGLTRGAFYFHFESKDALAVAIAEEQALRWDQLRRRVEATEADPLRRLVSLICATAFAFRDDATVRAAARLLLDRGLIERELPRTAPWWRDVIIGYLHAADAQGRLADLSFLQLTFSDARDDHDARGVERLAGILVTQMASTGLVAANRPDAQFELQHMNWAILLPRICATSEVADELMALARELLRPALTPVLPEQSR